MKKILSKIILFTLLSLQLATFTMPAIAQDLTDEQAQQILDDTRPDPNSAGDADTILRTFGNILGDAKENPCIRPESDDKNWTYIIAETPFTADQEQMNSENFKTRICFRNTFAYTRTTGPDANKEQIFNQLSTICSEQGENSFLNPPAGTSNLVKDIKFSCQQVQVLFSKGGTSTIVGVLSLLYVWAASLVGIVAVTVIVLSGIQISASGGDSQAIENAKTRILQSLSGIVILFLSGLLLYTINPNFFVL